MRKDFTDIKFLVMDVDGTLTDGKIYMGADGEAFKAFSVRDGFAIKEILPNNEIIPIIITARESRIVEKRCEELNVKLLFQNERNKLVCLQKVLMDYNENNRTEFSLRNVSYIGDDILDLECMKAVIAAGGVCGCPSDAVEKIKTSCSFICSKSGGNGAVREFIDWICML